MRDGYYAVLYVLLMLSILSTALVLFLTLYNLTVDPHSLLPWPLTTVPYQGPPPPGLPTSPILQAAAIFLGVHSLQFASGSWLCFGGFIIWRGRNRSRWATLGFDQNVFELFKRMKGATTRMRLLQNLQTPKDRHQLAKELGLEWRTVDWEIAVLRKYGLVQDQGSYGKIVMYQLTDHGMELLKLLRETEASAP
ncbi:MAG: helix-turn-helix transcriptional regulator [Nitrososphaerota archaeon]|nr:helix-turn-helix transcriptional regulator [Nitrososphaerota archaeon]MDG7040352.1 helix-turn-helix transcriptional regulator [Nitrososphaerota archaeon]MDG7047261.1 helix-turn-helix transcriptional regulator [Nitrososphaerota archaeon]